MDSASISHRGLFEEFVDLALRHQDTVPARDSAARRHGCRRCAARRAGTKAITISVPTRYVHTITEAIHKKDVRAAVDLLAAWLSTEPDAHVVCGTRAVANGCA